MKKFKNAAILSFPLWLFAILVIPYNWFNQQFVVNWFGCGCPKMGEDGRVIESYFNANDFTRLFWLFVSLCTTAISIFLSRRIPKDKIWFRIIYIAVIFTVSLFVAYQLSRLMMWN